MRIEVVQKKPKIRYVVHSPTYGYYHHRNGESSNGSLEEATLYRTRLGAKLDFLDWFIEHDDMEVLKVKVYD